MCPEKIKFTPEQLRAINSPDGEFVVKAGAGTGKTRVLVNKYINIYQRLIKAGDSPATSVSKILTLTFTRRAAKEMVSRLQTMISPVALLEARISTIDAFSARYLREHAFDAGLDPSFRVIDGVEARLIFRKTGKPILNNFLSLPLETDSSTDNFLSDAFSLINKLKQNLIGPNEFMSKTEGDRLGFAIGKLYMEYENFLFAESLMDFGRLLSVFYAYLSGNQKALEKIRKDYTHVLVDEYQDTNPAQVKLLKLIAAPENNYFAVGDEQQSIYGFRGAEPKSIMEFYSESPPEKKATLDLNFRTPPPIPDLINAVFKDEMLGYFPLKSGKDGSSEAQLFLAENKNEEARFLALKVKEFILKGYDPSDIVILLRGVKTAAEYEEALREQGIPSVTVGGLGFYGQPEIKDLVSMILTADNPYNDRELLRVLRSPGFGVSDPELARAVKESGKGSLYARLQGSDTESIRKSLEFIDKIREFWQEFSLVELINEILKESGILLRALTKTGGRDSRAASNIAKFISLARNFEESNVFSSPSDFAVYLRELESAGVDEPEARPRAEGVLHIMSIHQSKGLEFPVVFVSNITPSSFPARALMDKYHFTEKHGLVERDNEKNSLYTTYLKTPLYERHQQEEKRLLYVAMTRSLKHLILTGSRGSRSSISAFMKYFVEDSKNQVSIKEKLKSMLKLSPMPDSDKIENFALQAYENKEKETGDRIVSASDNLGLPRFVKKKPILEISVTGLKSYARCPLLYKYRYLMRLPVRPAENGFSPALFGTAVHRLLEESYREERSFPGTVEEALCSLILASGVSSEDYRKYYLDFAKKAVEGITTPGVLKSPEKILFTEQAFILKFDGAYIKGTIDRADKKPNYAIIDYKTSKSLTPSKYSLQLNIYRLAAKILFDIKNPALYICHIYTGKYVRIPRDRFISLRLQSLINGIRSEVFFPLPGSHCRWCSYFSVCPAYKKHPFLK
ncbi:MAG: ATP-dependent helicase [Elusimicrobia bacterium]|nr:ATP-dependent helicase [Elusimicrobiota bacterium]